MPWKFSGSFEQLEQLLSELGFNGKWFKHIAPTTQTQFKCENGEVLNFYWGTHTIHIQGQLKDSNSNDMLSALKQYLTYQEKR